MRHLLLISLIFCCFACGKEVKKTDPTPSSPTPIAINNTIDSVDLAILNGRVVDGTGKEAYKANVYIKDGRIIFVGKIKHPSLHIAAQIDATGKVVSPGFIDLHAHGNPIETPDFENFLAMGVTTIALGQDGSSPNLLDLKEYLDRVNRLPLGVNIAMFVGHGTLRNLTGIGLQEKLTEAQLEDLKSLLKRQLSFCFGLSTGLEYTPGRYANQEELVALAEIIADQDKVISSHMRNEDDEAILASITELAAQGKRARVHISHLKSVYGKGRERALTILDSIEKFRAQGIELTADSYPYLASYTGIAIVFPPWAKTPAQFAKAKKERRAELATFLRNKVNRRNGPEATLLGTAPYTGKTLAEVALEKNKAFEDVLIEDIGPQGASAAYFVMDKDLQETLMASPLVSIASDGSKTGNHPRGHGTFASFIETYVVNDSIIALEEAIRKITSFPADILGLSNRGRIAVNYIADLVIFDPKQVHATATYSDPFQLAKGFGTLIISGEIIRTNEQLTERRTGQVLTPKIK